MAVWITAPINRPRGTISRKTGAIWAKRAIIAPGSGFAPGSRDRAVSSDKGLPITATMRPTEANTAPICSRAQVATAAGFSRTTRNPVIAICEAENRLMSPSSPARGSGVPPAAGLRRVEALHGRTGS